MVWMFAGYFAALCLSLWLFTLGVAIALDTSIRAGILFGVIVVPILVFFPVLESYAATSAPAKEMIARRLIEQKYTLFHVLFVGFVTGLAASLIAMVVAAVLWLYLEQVWLIAVSTVIPILLSPLIGIRWLTK